jgi:hypothetical protein
MLFGETPVKGPQWLHTNPNVNPVIKALCGKLRQADPTSKKERKRKLKIQTSVKTQNASAALDLVSKDRNQLQPKLHRPCDGPYTIDKVYTNGTLKIRKGITSKKISICRVNPYNT